MKLAEELAAKEEEDANKKPKGKEETKEKGKKEKVNDEVRIEERTSHALKTTFCKTTMTK